jgi:hypothetical protein
MRRTWCSELASRAPQTCLFSQGRSFGDRRRGPGSLHLRAWTAVTDIPSTLERAQHLVRRLRSVAPSASHESDDVGPDQRPVHALRGRASTLRTRKAFPGAADAGK